MSTDHIHVWGKFGCYCGAQKCESFGYSNGELIGSFPLAGRIYFCNKPATHGKLCHFHSIAEFYLRSQSTISIAAVNREMETGEPAVAYTRAAFERDR